ncbi:MAG: hypothetical protein ACRDS0_31545 [Pseudonocardiaceae bacterium]
MATPDDPDFVPADDPRFVPYPDEPSMDASGPTDRNAPDLGGVDDADQS